jgi:hypothetical protein
MFTIRSITVGRMLAFGVAAACAGLVAQSPQWTAYTMIEAGPLPGSIFLSNQTTDRPD